MVQKISSTEQGVPIIITGDFNLPNKQDVIDLIAEPNGLYVQDHSFGPDYTRKQNYANIENTNRLDYIISN